MAIILESEVFKRKRFLAERLLAYGFQKSPGGYSYETNFMEDSFRAMFSVSDDGVFQGRVLDRMNQEEYAPLRMAAFNGPYVQAVRLAYADLLSDLAAKCCQELLFATDQANRVAEHIRTCYGLSPDFPWQKGRYRDAGVFRHPDTEKWFGLIMEVQASVLRACSGSRRIDIMNLKIDPQKGEALRALEGIFPAYHMNHKHWISVSLNEIWSDEEIMILVEESFRLTQSKTKRCQSVDARDE